MIEIHDDGGSGPVFDDCACGIDAAQSSTTTLVTKPSVPDWCFSPSGDNCDWYRECLEKRYPCKAQGNSYALDFAEKFCKLYDDHYSSFDSVGQRWINAVRKCLQVQLVPILRPFVHKTCDEIKQMAFDSHPDCYIYPDNHAPSMCQIGLVNTFKAFWTVKSALVQETGDTLKQMFCVGIGCNYITVSTFKALFSTKKSYIKLIMIGVKTGWKMIANRLVYDISEKLASQMKWPKKGIMHFAYTILGCSHSNRSKRSVDAGTSEFVHILLASRSEYDLNSKNAPPANVTEAAMELADRILNGDIDLGNGTEITELNICLNFNCTEKARSVTPPPTTTVVTTEMQTKVKLTESTTDESKEHTTRDFNDISTVEVNNNPSSFKVASTGASIKTEYFPSTYDTSTEMIKNAYNTTVSSMHATISNDNVSTSIEKNNKVTATSSKGHLNTWSIVGIVFGCIVVVICLIVLVTCLVKKRTTGSVV
ncbi:uncharacterized protein LOC123532498 [Mercenaria mercenaria]|uniref:uncharacterized protein LOC123532498 n=1 Tax=Mercenaria mercenaria TaxID=6596 RepID=UPI00234ED668|nr:uncharacterized protein LOC123532498 [Mercenaria mercenaria]XP_053373757.1 uncharacterized protein LOC123532498 [Mercenaria mercenaria]